MLFLLLALFLFLNAIQIIIQFLRFLWNEGGNRKWQNSKKIMWNNLAFTGIFNRLGIWKCIKRFRLFQTESQTIIFSLDLDVRFIFCARTALMVGELGSSF